MVLDAGQTAEQGTNTLVLPTGIGHRLPITGIGRLATFQTELTKGIDTNDGLITFSLRNRGWFKITNHLGFNVGREILAHVRTGCTTIYRLVRIPVRAMTRPLATLSTARFATIANLLVICNLAIHHALPVSEAINHYT